MKAVASVLILNAALAAAADLQPREAQLGKLFSGGLSSLMPEIKLADKKELKATLRPNAKRHKVRFGPLELLGQGQKKPTGVPSMDPNGQSYVKFINSGICDDDCTVLAGLASLEYEDGTRANPSTGVYVHHMLSFDSSKNGYDPVSRCDTPTVNVAKLGSGKSPMGPGFLGSSEDNADTRTLYTDEAGKVESGYHFHKGDRVMAQADLVNYSNQTKNVYLSYDVEYVPGIVGKDTASTLISVSGCGIGGPKLNKAGASVSKSKKFPVLVNGSILAAKGHLHNGGDKMVLYLNDKKICESLAEYKGDQIDSMTQCIDTIPVKRGDAISMESVYDLSKHPLRSAVGSDHAAHGMGGSEDVMGMWTMTIAIDDTQAGAAAAAKAQAPKSSAKTTTAPKGLFA